MGHCTLAFCRRATAMDLTTPLTFVKGIGPARAAMLEAKGLVTAEDLLGYVPFRYEDRSNMKTVAQLAPGEMATVIAEVLAVKVSGFRRRSLGLFEARFSDVSRVTLVGKWFHGGYLANVFAEGMRVALYGKVEFDSYAGELTMLHPEFEILSGEDDDAESSLHVGRVVPIYEAVAKLTTRVPRMPGRMAMRSARRWPAARFCAAWESRPMSCSATACPAFIGRFHSATLCSRLST